MAKRRSATRRAVKRSAKRSAKRGAYKSKKNQMKSRGRTQRGGELGALFSKATDAMTAASSNFSTGTALLTVGASIVNLITNIIKAVVPLIAMVYILSTIARNPGGMTGITKTARDTLKEKLAELKKGMAEFVENNDALKDCINTFETKVNATSTVPLLTSEVPQQSKSNIGKAVIYYFGQTGYQGVIVDEILPNEEYHDPMYLIWLNGTGYTMLKPVRQSQPVDNPEFRIVENENNDEFANLSKHKYGQQNGTIDGARNYYGIVSPNQGASGAPLPETTDPETEPDLFALLKGQMQLFSQAPDKKQFIVDVVNGYIAASKLRLERVMGRVQDTELRRCIQSIKEALTQQIKSQVAELKGKLSEIRDLTEFQKVFDTITGLSEGVKGLRAQATGLFGSLPSPFGRK
jgi:hypothetical protein